MIEASLDPINLPCGLIITSILEACDLSLGVVPFVSIKQCYNAITFDSTSYILNNDAWVC